MWDGALAGSLSLRPHRFELASEAPVDNVANVTVREAAVRLGVLERRVRKMVRDGLVRGATMAGIKRLIPTSVEVIPGKRGPAGVARLVKTEAVAFASYFMPTQHSNSEKPMRLPFPDRPISKTDPLYKRLPHYVFVLKPPLNGTTEEEFLKFAQDLKSGIAAKSMFEINSIPHSSLAGQELTLQSLKDEVIAIVSSNPIEWIRACVGISIMHHPQKRGKFVSILSKLPESAWAPGEKLLSVSHGDEVFAFNVKLHEGSFMPADGMFIWLDNPSDPAAEFIVASDGRGPLTLTNIYENRQTMEYFAMTSFCRQLIANGNATPSDLKPRYEPLGNAFPDFELLVREQEWAVEVTRIESGMVSYLRVSEPMEKDTFDKAAQKQVTESGVIAALMKALEDKTRRRKECPHYSRACLILVDVVDSVDVESPVVWNGIDLSGFDVVVLVKLDGSVSFIKGTHAFEPTS